MFLTDRGVLTRNSKSLKLLGFSPDSMQEEIDGRMYTTVGTLQ